MIEEVKWREAAECLGSWKRVLILSHARPDGDALGSMAAMKRFIEGLDGKADACLYEPMPERNAFLSAEHTFTQLDDAIQAGGHDGIVIVDTCSWSQLEPVAEFLRESPLPRIVVDHHATRDDVAGKSSEVTYLIDAEASSACAMIYQWCEAMGWAEDRATAGALFLGMATDTGWFRFSNTDSVTMRLAGRALEAGVRADRLYSFVYEKRSPERLILLGEVLSTLEFHAEGRLATMWVTPEMFELASAMPADTEEFVNEPLATEGVVASILLAVQAQGPIRANFRSKSPEVCGIDMDVAALAKVFDGGGHRRAAGARIEGQLDVVRDQVLQAALKAMQKADRQARGDSRKSV